MLTQRTDPAALLGWAHSLGQFTARHALIVGFAILPLAFLYRQGASLAYSVAGAPRARLWAAITGSVVLTLARKLWAGRVRKNSR